MSEFLKHLKRVLETVNKPIHNTLEIKKSLDYVINNFPSGSEPTLSNSETFTI